MPSPHIEPSKPARMNSTLAPFARFTRRIRSGANASSDEFSLSSRFLADCRALTTPPSDSRTEHIPNSLDGVANHSDSHEHPKIAPRLSSDDFVPTKTSRPRGTSFRPTNLPGIVFLSAVDGPKSLRLRICSL